ncbi:two-component system, LytTR family, sensor histidine kinase AgrC [Enterococcus sp. DIV0170]
MSPFLFNYFFYSQILIVALCFFILEKVYKEKIRAILLFLLLLVIPISVSISYSTLDLLVLFLLLFAFAYLVSTKKNPMRIILSIMCSALIEIMTTLFYIEVDKYCLSLKNQIMANFYLSGTILFSLLICIVLSIFLRNRLYPYLEQKGKLNSAAFFLMMVVFGFQAIEMIQNYADNQNLFFMFLLFYFILTTLIVMVIREISRNALLKSEAKNAMIIAELQKQYVDEVKKQYQETRKFRHDYTNLLSTINYFLENDKITELKDFFAKDIMKSNEELKENNLILDSLQNIESLGIRSIFYTKLLLAQERNIDVHIEIKEFLPEIDSMSILSLVRLFGIFLDNAIEELETIQTGMLAIVAFKENEDLVFIIQNTTRENVAPLQELKQFGVSTRGEKRGLGLSNVEEILSKELNILLETKIEEKLFIQRVTILSEVE